jgi:hypothetical protein
MSTIPNPICARRLFPLHHGDSHIRLSIFDVKKEGCLSEKDISACLHNLAEFLPNLQPAPLKDGAKSMPNMTIEETYRKFTSTTTMQRLVNGFIEALKASYCIREMEETQQVVTSYDLSLRGDLVKYTLADFLYAFRQSDDLQQRIFSSQNFEAAIQKDKDGCFKDNLTKKTTRVLGVKQIKDIITFSANEELRELYVGDGAKDALIQQALDNVGESDDSGPGVVQMSAFLGLDRRRL